MAEPEGDDEERYFSDPAVVRKIIPPFALLRLNADVRGKLLGFLVCASQDRALRAINDEREAVYEDQRSLGKRSFFDRPRPPRAVDISGSTRSLTTVLRGDLPASTAALVATLFHHTAALRLVCQTTCSDVDALARAPRSTATPRAWLGNLYCRHDAQLDDAAVIRELRARMLTGRRANLAREMAARQDAATYFVPQELGGKARRCVVRTDGAGFVTNDATWPQDNGRRRVFFKSTPGWSEKRRRMAQMLTFGRNSFGGHVHACTRCLTVDEANRNAPVDEALLREMSRTAISSTITSLRGATMTVVASAVTLAWAPGNSEHPPPDCFPLLEGKLRDFFGGRVGDGRCGWIERWTNKGCGCYDTQSASLRRHQKYWTLCHDDARPPLTTLAELWPPFNGNRKEVPLTRSGTTFSALIDIAFHSGEYSGAYEPDLNAHKVHLASAKAHSGTVANNLSFFRMGPEVPPAPIENIDLYVPLELVPFGPNPWNQDVGPGYFSVKIQARIPGFD